jgi:hypothetical protein
LVDVRCSQGDAKTAREAKVNTTVLMVVMRGNAGHNAVDRASDALLHARIEDMLRK